MTQDEIRHAIFTALYVGEVAILRRYSAPDHLSNERQKAEINFMVDDIASEVPGVDEDQLRAFIDKMHQNIRKTHRGRSWPSVGEFVKAMKLAVSEMEGPTNSTRGYGAALELDSDEIAADRINSGRPVADSYLWGAGAVRLLRASAVTEYELDRYREGLFQAEQDLVGLDEAQSRLKARQENFAKFEAINSKGN